MSWKNIVRKADAPLNQSDNPRLNQLRLEIKNLKTEMNNATNANRRNNLNSQIQAKTQEAKAIQAESNRKANWQNTLQNNPSPNAKSVVEETTQQTQPQQTQPQQTPQPPQPEEALTTNQKRQKQRRKNLINRGKEQAQRESVARNEQKVREQLPNNQKVVSGSNRDKLMEQVRIRQQRENQQAQAKQAKKDAKAQAKQAKKDARKNPNIAPSRLVPKQSVLNNPNSRLVSRDSPKGQEIREDRVRRLRPKENQSFSVSGGN